MAYLVGSCHKMCPPRERRRRECEGRLHKFEILIPTDGSKRPKADRKKIVKEYQRPAAGSKQAQAEDIRPPRVLRNTTNYLMTRILPREDVPWIMVYDFIFDRLRSVRQDLTIQQCCGPDVLRIYEQCIRFYTYAQFRLCEKPQSAFDPHINATHLQECLKQLLVLYKMESVHSPSSEIVALYLLHNLGSVDAVAYALSLSQNIRNQPAVKNAMNASIAWMHHNFVKVLRYVAAMSFLEACSIMPHLNKIHRHALLVMSVAYSCPVLKYPTKDLTALLLLDDDAQTEAICQYYGIELNGTFIKFSKNSFLADKQMVQWCQYGFLKAKSRNVDIVALITRNTSILKYSATGVDL